jgi:RsiW-degrading membrane proteinase PrsW (M82 family)
VDAAAAKPGIPHHIFALLLALMGGALGIMGAFVQEVRSGGGLLLPFIGAPVIEEGLKPLGVYLLLFRWPRLLRGQLHTAVLAALAGLSFGVIESVIYLTLYVPDHTDNFALYRFTAPLALHATASFLVGLGINDRLLAWAKGEGPLPKSSRNLFIAAVLLHAAFNITAVTLTATGVLDVE